MIKAKIETKKDQVVCNFKVYGPTHDLAFEMAVLLSRFFKAIETSFKNDGSAEIFAQALVQEALETYKKDRSEGNPKRSDD